MENCFEFLDILNNQFRLCSYTNRKGLWHADTDGPNDARHVLLTVPIVYNYSSILYQYLTKKRGEADRVRVKRRRTPVSKLSPRIRSAVTFADRGIDCEPCACCWPQKFLECHSADEHAPNSANRFTASVTVPVRPSTPSLLPRHGVIFEQRRWLSAADCRCCFRICSYCRSRSAMR